MYILQKTRLRQLLFVFIILIGITLRGVLMFKRDIFTDEAVYLAMAKNTVWSIVTVANRTADHGMLYYLLLKFEFLFTKNLSFLRLSNIPLYIIEAYCLHLLFKKFNFGIIGLLGVLLFSVHKYFVYMGSWISPYNLVLCLFLVSVTSLTDIVQRKQGKILQVIFVISTASAFYSDYSFILTLFFYGSLLFLAWGKEKQTKNLLVRLYSAVTLLILPGIVQLIGNISRVKELNNPPMGKANILEMTQEFSHMFFRIDKNVSLSIGVICLVFVLWVSINNKDIYRSFISGFIGSMGLFYIANRYFVSIFNERVFWYFYLSVLCMGIYIVHYFKQMRFTASLFISICLVIYTSVVGYLTFNVPGDITYEIEYRPAMRQIMKIQEKNPRKVLHIVMQDEQHSFVPIPNYYLSSFFNSRILIQRTNIDKYYFHVLKSTEETKEVIARLNKQKKEFVHLYFGYDRQVLDDIYAEQSMSVLVFFLKNSSVNLSTFVQYTK